MIKKKLLTKAKEVINLEIKALQNLKKNINKAFSDAVICVSKCQSKVILCGVGKSGLIASKIAATLASVGTPSFSISASENALLVGTVTVSGTITIPSGSTLVIV